MIIHVHTGDSTTTGYSYANDFVLSLNMIVILAWVQEMGWKWWNNAVGRRRQWTQKKSHGPTADVTHLHLAMKSEAWRHNAIEGILSQCRAWEQHQDGPTKKGVIFLSTQGDIQPLNDLRRTCQSHPIRPGQSICDLFYLEMWCGNRRWIINRKLWICRKYYIILQNS